MGGGGIAQGSLRGEIVSAVTGEWEEFCVDRCVYGMVKRKE